MNRRMRPVLASLAIGGFAFYAAIAQQKLNLPVEQKPGEPKKVLLPEGPPAEGAMMSVVPGPEPWYTVFGTGEVVGYIEPCG